MDFFRGREIDEVSSVLCYGYCFEKWQNEVIFGREKEEIILSPRVFDILYMYTCVWLWIGDLIWLVDQKFRKFA